MPDAATDKHAHPATPAIGANFRREASPVLKRLSAAVGSVLTSFGGEYRRAADIRRVLPLDTKLCTQLFRVAFATDPVAVAFHVPGPPSMSRFVAAVEARAPAELVQTLRDAYAAFLKLVESVAGDRTAFDSIAAGLASPRGDTVDRGNDSLSVLHRKRAFKAMSHVLGVQTQLLYRCSIFDGEHLAHLRLFQDVMRLSSADPITLYRSRTRRYSGTPLPDQFSRQPVMEGLPTQGGINLFPSFSSEPLPKVNIVDGVRGSHHADLLGSRVGSSGAMNCALGHVDRDVMRPDADATAKVTTIASAAGIYIPTAHLICDLLVPRGAFNPATLRSEVFSNVYALEIDEPDVWHRLPIVAEPQVVPGPGTARTGVLAHCHRFLRFAMEGLDWQREDFDHFRVEVEYPVLFSSILLMVDPRIAATEAAASA